MNPFASEPKIAIADTKPALAKIFPVLSKKIPGIKNPCPQLRPNVADALLKKLKKQ
jgi:hypothetical protein